METEAEAGVLGPTHVLTSDPGPQDCEGARFWCFKPPASGHLSRRPHTALKPQLRKPWTRRPPHPGENPSSRWRPGGGTRTEREGAWEQRGARSTACGLGEEVGKASRPGGAGSPTGRC